MSANRPGSVLAAAGLVLLGLAVGLLAALQHSQSARLGGLDVPWGMALSLLTTWSVAAGSGALARRGATWFALGWTVHLLLGSRGGGYLVADDALGWTYTLGGAVGLVLVVLASRRPGERRRPAAPPRSRT